MPRSVFVIVLSLSVDGPSVVKRNEERLTDVRVSRNCRVSESEPSARIGSNALEGASPPRPGRRGLPRVQSPHGDGGSRGAGDGSRRINRAHPSTVVDPRPDRGGLAAHGNRRWSLLYHPERRDL